MTLNEGNQALIENVSSDRDCGSRGGIIRARTLAMELRRRSSTSKIQVEDGFVCGLPRSRAEPIKSRLLLVGERGIEFCQRRLHLIQTVQHACKPVLHGCETARWG